MLGFKTIFSFEPLGVAVQFTIPFHCVPVSLFFALQKGKMLVLCNTGVYGLRGSCREGGRGGEVEEVLSRGYCESFKQTLPPPGSRNVKKISGWALAERPTEPLVIFEGWFSISLLM